MGGPGSGRSARSETEAELKALVIKSLQERPFIKHACMSARVARKRINQWIADDPEFAEAVKDAKEDTIEALEEAARERALRDSDRLLEFLLRAARPEVYRERATVTHEGEILQRTIIFNGPSDEPGTREL